MIEEHKSYLLIKKLIAGLALVLFASCIGLLSSTYQLGIALILLAGICIYLISRFKLDLYFYLIISYCMLGYLKTFINDKYFFSILVIFFLYLVFFTKGSNVTLMNISQEIKMIFIYIFVCFVSYIVEMFSFKQPNWILPTRNFLGILTPAVTNFQSIFVALILVLTIYMYTRNNFDKINKFLKYFITISTLIFTFDLLLYVLGMLGFNLSMPYLVRDFLGTSGVWGNRLAGTAYEPLALGNQVASVLPITLSFILNNSNTKKLLLWIALFIQLLTLIFSFSTGGWFVTAFGVILVLILSNGAKQNLNKILLGVVVLLIIPIAYFFLKISGNLDYVIFTMIQKLQGSDSFLERDVMNSALLKMFLNFPILGVGFGSFVYYLENYGSYSLFSFIPTPIPELWRANNDYLTILAETGLVGFLAFISIFIVISFKSINTLRYLKNNINLEKYKGVIIGLYCSILAVAMQFWSGFLMYNIYFWLLIGLLTSVLYYVKDVEGINKNSISKK